MIHYRIFFWDHRYGHIGGVARYTPLFDVLVSRKLVHAKELLSTALDPCGFLENFKIVSENRFLRTFF